VVFTVRVLLTIEFGGSHAWNLVMSLFVLKIDFSPNIDENLP